jgi:hypothetical protein
MNFEIPIPQSMVDHAWLIALFVAMEVIGAVLFSIGSDVEQHPHYNGLLADWFRKDYVALVAGILLFGGMGLGVGSCLVIGGVLMWTSLREGEREAIKFLLGVFVVAAIVVGSLLFAGSKVHEWLITGKQPATPEESKTE